MNSDQQAPQFADVLAAQERIRGQALQTPVLLGTALDEVVKAKVFLKCENLQRVGAFKFRGAWNTMVQLTDDERSNGVIAYSSGNHAQAVALCGKLLGIKTTIVMPDNAPQTKQDATKRYGASIVSYNPEEARREEVTAKLIDQRGFTLVPPFDHPHIIAGQGTAALELFDTVGTLDTLLVPCGGGGLLAGSALSADIRSPLCQVIGVEPELADDAARSYRSGRLHRVVNPPTIADGARTESLGKIPFNLIKRLVADIVTVPEQAIIDAVRYAFFNLKLVVEPSGALGVAALLSGAVSATGRIGILVSGGNIDTQVITECLD
jgi:threonine dehydratase